MRISGKATSTGENAARFAVRQLNGRGMTMKQQLDEKHEADLHGDPAGGSTMGVGIGIKWQNGPLGRRKKPDGAFVEGVVQAAIGRLQFYQEVSEGKFNCREHAIAISHLETAILWLEKANCLPRKRKSLKDEIGKIGKV